MGNRLPPLPLLLLSVSFLFLSFRHFIKVNVIIGLKTGYCTIIVSPLRQSLCRHALLHLLIKTLLPELPCGTEGIPSTKEEVSLHHAIFSYPNIPNAPGNQIDHRSLVK